MSSKYEKILNRIKNNKIEIQKELNWIAHNNPADWNWQTVRLFILLMELKRMEYKTNAMKMRYKRYERNQRDLVPAQYR